MHEKYSTDTNIEIACAGCFLERSRVRFGCFRRRATDLQALDSSVEFLISAGSAHSGRSLGWRIAHWGDPL